MPKSLMTSKQMICTLILFTLGSSLVIGVNTESKQDSWIVILLALLLFTPMLIVYSRIAKIYPGHDLYEIAIIVFGNTFGKMIILLYVFYSIHLGALVMRNFSEFIQVATLPETPQLVLLLFMFTICVWMVKSGVKTFGRWAKFIMPLVIISILGLIIISIKFMDFSNIKPVGVTNFGRIMNSSFAVFSFPFAETVLFTILFSSINKDCNPLKIYAAGILISSFLLLLVFLRNTFVLGVQTMSMYYFPSYEAASIIGLGEFFTRIEVLIGMVFLFAGFVKVCVCMFAASMGISKLINDKDYGKLAVPTGIIMVTLATIVYPDIAEMVSWLDTYKYYAFPFQVIFPIIILIGAEIKTRSDKLAISSE